MQASVGNPVARLSTTRLLNLKTDIFKPLITFDFVQKIGDVAKQITGAKQSQLSQQQLADKFER